MNRVPIDIEGLISWTYRDQLPLRHEGGSWGTGGELHPMWRMGRFGARIDCWTRDPGFPLAMGDPDPDALEVEMAVNDLKGYGLAGVPAEAMIVGLPLEPEDVPGALERASKSARVLVGMHGKLRSRPPVGACEIHPRRLHNGAVGIYRIAEVTAPTIEGEAVWEAEVPVRQQGKKTYPPGAYCNVDWTPHPKHILLERSEYLAWRAALAHLAEVLDGKLRRYVVIDTDAPVAPWLRAPRPVRLERVLEAVSA